MTFLQPLLLLGLPLAALPVIIHLIHLYRRRRVKWAAMIFLHAAQRMNKGLSRLRQVLILALRVLALLTIIFMVARPLAGGWLGLTGGAPDTVLILVDRSASMSQMNTATGVNKLTGGLQNIAKAISDAVGTRSRLVLIDSATGKPLPLDRASALLNVPQSEPTDTAADIPGLLQDALDYITTNKTGRTDVWMLSDLQQTDWDASGGRWQTLRTAFAALPGVRFHLLAYPQPAPDDIGITIDRVQRRETPDKAELLLDLRIVRHTKNPQPIKLPLSFVVNGAATSTTVDLRENQLVIEGYSVPIDRALKKGWGCVELPADSFPANDKFYFVFDQPPPLRSVIVSDDDTVTGPISAALSAAADPSRQYECTVLGTSHAAEIPWNDAAMIVWNAPLPKETDITAKQLRDYLAAGRTILFLPPESPDDTKIFDIGWDKWQQAPAGKPFTVEWWRTDDDLLANTRDGSPLAVGKLELGRVCGIVGDGVPLARVGGQGPLLLRSLGRNGNAYFLGTLPGSSSSSLARDGVVMYALLQRALNQGVATLGKAQQRYASANVLGDDPTKWKRIEPEDPTLVPENLPLRAGIVSSGDRLVALNRPPGEDQPATLAQSDLNDLFAGLDFHVVNDTLENGSSLTNEVWRTFLFLAALALVCEALLCMPPPRDPTAPAKITDGFSKPAAPAAATVE
ncbi:MAG TPA: BatA domain-containing protein [Candidatus Methylacidiphilales bacterium]|jgi:hypothetical protein|nr:BatA domain-containing protein [Candidatus Methylacidiphilales bacterium]